VTIDAITTASTSYGTDRLKVLEAGETCIGEFYLVVNAGISRYTIERARRIAYLEGSIHRHN
jgi:hypothetical protein